MDGGWVKLYRQIIDSRVFQNAGLLKVWLWCMCKATRRHRWVTIRTGRGETEVELQPGQFVFGRLRASRELKMKTSSVRNRMAKLKKCGNLDIKADRHHSIVTVCNWKAYQETPKQEGQQEGQAKDNQRTSKGQPKDTDKNVKKVKKVRSKSCAPDDLFESFWKAFPPGRKKSKAKAREAWTRAIEAAQPDAIVAAAVEYAASSEGRGQYVKMPATWLNGGCWDDDRSAWGAQAVSVPSGPRPLTPEEAKSWRPDGAAKHDA